MFRDICQISKNINEYLHEGDEFRTTITHHPTIRNHSIIEETSSSVHAFMSVLSFATVDHDAVNEFSFQNLDDDYDSGAFTTTEHFNVVPRQWRSSMLQITTYSGGEDMATRTPYLFSPLQMVKCVACFFIPRPGKRVSIMFLRYSVFTNR